MLIRCLHPHTSNEAKPPALRLLPYAPCPLPYADTLPPTSSAPQVPTSDGPSAPFAPELTCTVPTSRM